FGRNLPFAAAVRAAVRGAGLATPVVASGGINSFTLAERALREGACDLVGAARQPLPDPDWFLKLRAGPGAAISRCLYTNGCEALDQKRLQVPCQPWDRLRREGEQASMSTDGRRRLVAPRGEWTPPRRGTS